MQASRVEMPLGGQTLSMETGKLAKQAHGSVVVGLGDTLALVAAVEGPEDNVRDFFPLVVDYREKTYAAGKFPGGFIKREGRPTTKEILTSRLIDRPVRPLFPSGYLREVQIMASTLAADRDHDPDVLSMIGASAALHVSHIPFLKPTGSVRIGSINGELVLMPTHVQLEESQLDLVLAGTRTQDKQAVPLPDLGKKLAERLRPLFTESLEQRWSAGTLPPTVGALVIKKKPHLFLLADVRMAPALHDRQVHVWMHPHGTVAAMPLPGGVWRWFLEMSQQADTGEESEEATWRVVQRAIAERVPEVAEAAHPGRNVFRRLRRKRLGHREEQLSAPDP